MKPLEIWASPEPTVARIGAGRWRDQLIETGHESRDGDIDRLSALGVRATRYPILWERVSPEHPERHDFRWSDRRMRMLSTAGIEPIVTLLHHGSGPAYTDLLDPLFPSGLAAYAGAVARRYPHVRRWTPVNEPLTTARFSTLYGSWYPHGRFDHAAFGRAIVNEALGTQLAMRAIREVRPDAELLLTEDLQGFVAGDDDDGVAAYVAHKAERRYLSAELILGRVDRHHSLWSYLTVECGLAQREFDAVRRWAMPIDCMGWNYYPLSERLLSRENGRVANVALIDAGGVLNPLARIREAAARLRVPVALSEVHCFGTEDDRARWLLERWNDACEVRADGIDLRAFGAWAAFGLVDWRSLLCRDDAEWEDGIYTCAGLSGEPQPTRVAAVLRELVAGRLPVVPAGRGWWERGPSVAA